MPPTTTPAAQLVQVFNERVNAADVDGMLALMTDDCIFENTFPGPDGTRYTGQAAVRGFWEEFYRTSRQPRFETEEIIEAGDRVVVRWVYHWLDERALPGHVRGIDVFRVRGDLIAEKLSYVKG